MTAKDSSSSVTNPIELDLLESGRLPPLPTAFLTGRDLDLLAPLRFLAPGELPVNRVEPPTDRAGIAAALETANAAYGHPRAAELAARLAAPETLVVATGQQPGLYGGPLLGLTKMMAAVRWAEDLCAAGRPAVAVFWVATEDHDWAELSRATFLDRHEPRRLDLGADPAPLMPIGMRTFGAALGEQELTALPGMAPEDLELVQRFYRPNARFGEAFSRLMVGLLGARAPLMLDAMLPEIKRLERPWLRRLVEERHVFEEALTRAEQQVVARGYALQVTPQPGLSPLFMLHGFERRRVAWEGEKRFGLRGLEMSADVGELLATIDENPAVVSPGVLARPAIQDALLGTTLQVMGPSELTYLSQARAAYEVLQLDAPYTSLRPQVMLLDDRQIAHLRELDVELEELLSKPLERLLADKLGEDVVAPVRQRVDDLLGGLEEPLRRLDRSLENPLRKTRDQISRALEQLTGKAAAAVARRHEVWHRRLEQLQQFCLPKGHLQERELAVAYFLGRFGPRFVAAIEAQMDLDPRRLQVIEISK